MEYVKYSLKEYLDFTATELGRMEAIKALGLQMLSAIRHLHEKGVLHQDIKPQNFRVTEKGVVKLLDFRLAQKYDDRNRHKPFGKFGIQGTPFFASISALQGFTLSRRDDIESLGFAIMHLIDPETPWAQCETIKEVLLQKQAFLSMNLNNVPQHYYWIQKFIISAAKLKYTEQPDYSHFEYLIRNLTRPPSLASQVHHPLSFVAESESQQMQNMSVATQPQEAQGLSKLAGVYRIVEEEIMGRHNACSKCQYLSQEKDQLQQLVKKQDHIAEQPDKEVIQRLEQQN
ncbi:hypothetical protein FGO68_gene16835 [Halteria grandinella]|uniref:Casein kinase I n=1 Tax=Halteria grandinella TaxID=5974 RepID=A0A8J8NWP8_HALGN|nr:hypothetical protein FGO68_gene16835 [Halteria grandinella]